MIKKFAVYFGLVGGVVALISGVLAHNSLNELVIKSVIVFFIVYFIGNFLGVITIEAFIGSEEGKVKQKASVSSIDGKKETGSSSQLKDKGI